MSDERTDGGAPPPRLASPAVVRRRNWLPSLIWLIPIVAAMVGISLVAQILLNRGPAIELTFKTAEGLEPGKTAVRYKDVQIGKLESLRLADDRSHVSLQVQLNKEARSFTAADTRFWVVRPRLDTSGVSGLGTLFSGAYIGVDAGVSHETRSQFTGLEEPPVITRDAVGRLFTLHATDLGSLDFGSPVYYRRIKVGQVASYQMDSGGSGVLLQVFVNAPYDQYVGSRTRFWHASGIDLQLSASGFTVRTQSLATIVLGGIAFAAPDDLPGPAAQRNASFLLAADEANAMKPPDGVPQQVVMYFNQSVRGLYPGAPLDFRGIVIGEVRAIGVQFDRTDRELLMAVSATIYPDRLRRANDTLDEAETPALRQARLQKLYNLGLRAQLRTGNLLTGQLFVALDFFPKEKHVAIDASKSPWEVPTVPNSLDALTTQVQEIATKINRIPFDQLGGELRKTMAQLDRALTSTDALVRNLNVQVTPEIAGALKDARKTLDSAERTLSDTSPLQQDARQTLQELTRAAASIRILADYLERQPQSLLFGKPDPQK